MTPADVIREMRDSQWGLSPQVKAWTDAIEAAMREKDAEIERLREALAHYATDETADGWIAIAALAATEEDKP